MGKSTISMAIKLPEGKTKKTLLCRDILECFWDTLLQSHSERLDASGPSKQRWYPVGSSSTQPSCRLLHFGVDQTPSLTTSDRYQLCFFGQHIRHIAPNHPFWIILAGIDSVRLKLRISHDIHLVGAFSDISLPGCWRTWWPLRC